MGRELLCLDENLGSLSEQPFSMSFLFIFTESFLETFFLQKQNPLGVVYMCCKISTQTLLYFYSKNITLLTYV